MPTISAAVPFRIGVATLAILVCGYDARAQADSSFAKVVAAHFAEWDLDRDGSLSASEIDRLMNRPDVRGDAAAALAAIKLRERAAPSSERARYAASVGQLTGPGSDLEPVDPSDPARDGKRIISYETVFRYYVHSLTTINRKLFAGDGPNFQAMKQGPVGDCYFFSLVGYLAAREPKKIARMIVPEADGGYVVRFFDGERVRVAAPTDAEVLLNNSSSSLEDGIWLAVLEKALGEKMRRAASASNRTAEATDAMAAGGTTGLIIRLLSGHRDTEVRLRESRYFHPRLDLLRRVLPQVLAKGMLAAAEMGKEPPTGWAKVPGLGYTHAYAILGYDPATDKIMLWNPWGEDFTPSGPEGPAHGFATRHGVFQLPLRTFYGLFSSVHLETFSRAVLDDGPVYGLYPP
jgi:hypothetical protein